MNNFPGLPGRYSSPPCRGRGLLSECCIKKEIGVPPVQYLKDHRLQQARILLKTSEITVYEVAEEFGYSNVDSFSRVFKNKFGVSPTNFQKNKQNLIFY
ncbi:helix-turn-helix domain-containing protein [Paenibacillus zanthoxyli]|uniref:helix-turn-helix domain-containing protein n=1 Tax=Paenibacillus zanthoxyli TaxID=369399 RepID=UPI000A02050C